MSRNQRSPGRRSLMGSVVIHVAILIFFWASTQFRPEPMVFETYAISIVSPPPAVEAAEPTPAQEELVVEAPPEMKPPEPTPPAPQPERRPDPTPPTTQPAPARPTPPPPREPEPQREPARGPDAQPNTRGGENIVVQMEGLRRDYPEYYGRIVSQISRCFNQRRPPEGRWETTLDFFIAKDGKVDLDQIRVVKRSGNVTFDYQAMGAVECAGDGDRFGPLPADLPVDRLPIRFTFTPAGAGGP